MAKQNKIFPNHPSIICGENNAYLFVVTLWIQVIHLNRGRLGGLLYILDKKRNKKIKKENMKVKKTKKIWAFLKSISPNSIIFTFPLTPPFFKNFALPDIS